MKIRILFGTRRLTGNTHTAPRVSETTLWKPQRDVPRVFTVLLWSTPRDVVVVLTVLDVRIASGQPPLVLHALLDEGAPLVREASVFRPLTPTSGASVSPGDVRHKIKEVNSAQFTRPASVLSARVDEGLDEGQPTPHCVVVEDRHPTFAVVARLQLVGSVQRAELGLELFHGHIERARPLAVHGRLTNGNDAVGKSFLQGCGFWTRSGASQIFCRQWHPLSGTGSCRFSFE